MKTLELNQMELVNGGIDGCDVGSAIWGTLIGAGAGFFSFGAGIGLGIYASLTFSLACEAYMEA